MWNLFRRKRYAGHPEAVVVSCFFNPMRSPYRLSAFARWYKSIRHLNHRIVECVIGDDQPELPAVCGDDPHVVRVHTPTLLWHKEALLNGLIARLPAEFKYVLWVDADVLFANRNWVPEAVRRLQSAQVVQLFEYCVHLDRDEEKPAFDVGAYRANVSGPGRHPKMWKSFAANYVQNRSLSADTNYDAHGHVGFAWGARRGLLDKCPLYDRALIGGADHIIAHAAAGQIPHPCIDRGFADDIGSVRGWSLGFSSLVQGRLSYVDGDLYHLWHGDIDKRDYLKRIIEFTPKTKAIRTKDAHGLYVATHDDERYVRQYFAKREVGPAGTSRDTDDNFMLSMGLGYMTDSAILGWAAGGNMGGAMLGQMMRDSHDHSYTNGAAVGAMTVDSSSAAPIAAVADPIATGFVGDPAVPPPADGPTISFPPAAEGFGGGGDFGGGVSGNFS